MEANQQRDRIGTTLNSAATCPLRWSARMKHTNVEVNEKQSAVPQIE